jgi:hypothetical protein
MKLTLEIHVVFYNSAYNDRNILEIHIFFAKKIFGTSIAIT